MAEIKTDEEFINGEPPREQEVQEKLTDWKNEPTLTTLKNDLQATDQPHKAQMTKLNEWANLMNVTGPERPAKRTGRSAVQPKLVKRQAEWRYSALTEPFLGSNKLFKVSPQTFEDAESARQNELLLNWQFRTKMNRVKFIDNFVRATVDEGTSIARVTWEREVKMKQVEKPVYDYIEIEDEESAALFEQAVEMRNADPRTFDEEAPDEMKAAMLYYDEHGMMVTAEATGEMTMVEEEDVIVNRPRVEIKNPRNIYIDPSCNDDFEKALFVIESYEVTKAELLKQPETYKNLDAVKWSANAPSNTPDHETNTPTDFQLGDDLRSRAVMFEYWGFHDIDGTGELVPIVAAWIGDTLVRMEKNPYPDQKLPYVVTTYLPVKRSVYGEPDAEFLGDNQRILGALMRSTIDLMGRSANAQRGTAKGMLDPVNNRRFQSGEDYEFNPGTNPANGLIEHKFPEIPNSAIVMMQLQNQEAEALTGVKSFSGGVSGDAYGDVAAGIRGALDAASKREMAILRRLAKGLVDIGSKVISMNAVFLSDTEIIRVTNRQQIKINREDLQGFFDLEVDISTAEVDDAKAKELAFLLQTLGPNTDPGVVTLILSEIADLKRMPEIAEKIRTYKPEPSPEQQRLAELEIALKEAEVQKVQAEIALIQAQTKKFTSEAHLKDLEYVEEDTGVNHARDLEKMRAQSEGNAELELIKATVKPTKPEEKAPDIEAGMGLKEINDRLHKQKHPTSWTPEPEMASVPNELNINSTEFDPAMDPALNPAMNF